MDSFPITAPAFNGKSRVVPAGNAFEWFKQGWAMFAANPGIWIALAVVLIVIIVALNIVPFIGPLAANLLTPLFTAGLLAACEKSARGEPGSEAVEISDLFAGFKRNASNLAMLGVLYMLGMLAIFFVVAILSGGSIAGGMMMGQAAGIGVAFGGILLATLLSLVLSVPLFMAMWFAPALVYFNNMAPIEALKASFNACLKNLLVFLVFGVVAMILSFFAALPVGLGFLILIPVLAGSLYVAYRDIFVAN